MIVKSGKIISLSYWLTDEEGHVLKCALSDAPMQYRHGTDRLLGGLESRLEGLSKGASVRLHLDDHSIIWATVLDIRC
jgi:FKBP-type peptidyl-prolyl cis-trans isomerase 2